MHKPAMVDDANHLAQLSSTNLDLFIHTTTDQQKNP